MNISLVRRRAGAVGPELAKQTLGNALVVHPASGMTKAAQALALNVAADREHDLVVVDLPVNSPISMWESVANALPRRRRGVRLVIGGRSRETSALAAQWIAERIGRTVVASDGAVIPSADGGLFVHSGRGTGWVRFRPGRPPKWESKRFPRPSWDSDQTSELTSTSSRGVAEPLPGGLWVRPAGFDDQQCSHRRVLIRSMPVLDDSMTVVLGCPDGPPITLDDTAELWTVLPEHLRDTMRFVRYGAMSISAGTMTGQALADQAGREVVCYTGMPVAAAPSLHVRTVMFEGRLGWAPFAQSLRYLPRPSRGAPAPLPQLVAYRPPVPGLTEVAPAVYWYSPDVVLEVVQSGLLLRPLQESAATVALRAVTLDNSLHNLTFDAPNEWWADRLRSLAHDMLTRLDEGTCRVSRILSAQQLLAERIRLSPPSSASVEIEAGGPMPLKPGPAAGATHEAKHPTPRAPASAEPVGSPASEIEQRLSPEARDTQVLAGRPAASVSPSTRHELVAEPPAAVSAVTESVAPQVVQTPTTPGVGSEPPPYVEARQTEVRLQSMPDFAAAALLSEHGADKEREWLRKSLGADYGLMSNAVARILAEHPGFQGDRSTLNPAVLTDAVAVSLYLSAKGASIDAALRTGAAGPHVPIARCVVAGLRRLPSHRGPATFPVSLSASAWRLVRSLQVVVEWGFLNAVAQPTSSVDGDTDVLIWSITGRRTKLLELREGGVDNRVLFVPGTTFKVMECHEPTADARGLVLLRELTETEVAETGEKIGDHGLLDELALVSLRRELDSWIESDGRLPMDDTAAARFGSFPGLA